MKKIEVKPPRKMSALKESQLLKSASVVLPEVGSNQISHVHIVFLAVHTYMMKDGHIRELLPHVF